MSLMRLCPVSLLVVASWVLPAAAFELEAPSAARAPGVREDTAEVLVFLKPGEDIHRFARNHGLAVKQSLVSDPNAYVLAAPSPQAARTAADTIRGQRDARVRFAGVNQRTAYVKMAFVPNDPYFHKNTPSSGWRGQWHLTNEWTAGRDIRVQGAWGRDATGSGVIIGVVDDCLETGHPDLSPNYAAGDSWDFGQNDGNPDPVYTDDQHGVSTSGVAAARGGNGLGVTGVAPYAGLAGLRIDFNTQTSQMFADATLFHSSGANTSIKVKNHSYGIDVPYVPSTLEENALVTSADAGTIHCFAAGNHRSTLTQDANVQDLQNNPKCICVAAFGSDGRYSSYSNFGACVAVTAPSSSSSGYAITTTDRTGTAGYNTLYAGDTFPDTDYTSRFGGTSSATPTVAGVMALVKQVQPALDVRFAKHLLAITSDVVDAADSTTTSDGGWRTNAGGTHFNQNYGFGLIDADELTLVAPDYSGVTPPVVFDTGTASVNAAIPDKKASGVTRTFNVTDTTPLEEVEVAVVVSHIRDGDLEIHVTSPSGYTSRLTKTFSGSSGNYPLSWSFTTNALWGENPAGTWTVKVADIAPGLTGIWNSYRVTLHMGELISINAPPIVAQNPQPQTVCPGTTAVFTVAAGGTGPLNYRWQKDNADINDSGHYSGTTTTTLTISDASSADAGNYRCRITNNNGSTYSDSAALTLIPAAPPDLDQDCDVDPDDRTILQGCSYGAAIPVGAGCLPSDFDNDGDVDLSDFGILQRCYTGPGGTIDPNCAN